MTEETIPTPPKIFISYTHENRDHKAWVAELAGKLRGKGVDVILDQWDTEPGDNLALFMQKGITEADRVLMICTEAFTRKVDDGKGGAGYEAMIVSAELMQDQGLKKFIPVIRQTSEARSVPVCLSARFYIDLSADKNFEEEFARLLETLHKVVQSKKPALGPNPFTGVDLRAPETKAAELKQAEQYSKELHDPLAAYATAQHLIAQGNLAQWRKFLQTVERDCAERLLAWKKEKGSECPKTFDPNAPQPIVTYVAQGTSSYDPYLACLLAASESGNPQFSGLLSWVDSVWEPKGWERSGSVIFTEFPRTILYVLHTTVGAMLMLRGAGNEAVSLATTQLRDSSRNGKAKPLYLTTDVNGWTDTLQHTCTVGWQFLNHVDANSSWLKSVFATEDELRIGRTAYYMLLSFLEFCRLVIVSKGNFEPDKWHLEVPLDYCLTSEEILRPAYQLLLGQADLLKSLLVRNRIDQTTFEGLWATWIKANYRWLGEVYRWRPHTASLPQANLPKDLFRDLFDLGQSP